MTTKLSTGVELLDDILDGGITGGSIVVLGADPASQSGLLLSQVASSRRTLYLTTLHSTATIEEFLTRTDVDISRITVRRVDTEAPLEHAYTLVRSMPHGSNLVIDAMDPLEDADPTEFWSFMNAVRAHLEQVNGLAFFHCLNGRRVPELRDTTEYMADVVFDLSTEFDGEELVNRLLVPKIRGEQAVGTVIKLDLSHGVTVDTSRDIG